MYKTTKRGSSKGAKVISNFVSIPLFVQRLKYVGNFSSMTVEMLRTRNLYAIDVKNNCKMRCDVFEGKIVPSQIHPIHLWTKVINVNIYQSTF